MGWTLVVDTPNHTICPGLPKFNPPSGMGIGSRWTCDDKDCNFVWEIAGLFPTSDGRVGIQWSGPIDNSPKDSDTIAEVDAPAPFTTLINITTEQGSIIPAGSTIVPPGVTVSLSSDIPAQTDLNSEEQSA